MAINALGALGIQAGSQLVGAGLGSLLGSLNRVDPNDAYQDAPQYQEFSPELEQAYQERARIGQRVNERRQGTLARILAQSKTQHPMTTNSSRNVAQANAQNQQMMSIVAGVEDNLGRYEDRLEDRADNLQMQGRGRLAEIMQLNSQARQQAAQQARLANRQQQAAGMATGLQLGSTMGSGIVNYTMFNDQLNFEREREARLQDRFNSLFSDSNDNNMPLSVSERIDAQSMIDSLDSEILLDIFNTINDFDPISKITQ